MIELDKIASAVADRCHGARKVGQAPHRYAVICQAARLGAIEMQDAQSAHIAALEATSRALAAKLEECGPYLPHGSVRVELDALIAVLKETK